MDRRQKCLDESDLARFFFPHALVLRAALAIILKRPKGRIIGRCQNQYYSLYQI